MTFEEVVTERILQLRSECDKLVVMADNARDEIVKAGYESEYKTAYSTLCINERLLGLKCSYDAMEKLEDKKRYNRAVELYL